VSKPSVLDQIIDEVRAAERDKNMRVAYVYMTPACYDKVRNELMPGHHGWQFNYRGELSVAGVPFLVQGFARSQWGEVRYKVSYAPPPFAGGTR
jgi:hypothetical protein